MSAIVIPCVQGQRAYSVDCDLDGTTYTLTFDFSVREGYWYLGIYDQAGDVLAGGRKIVTDWPLTYGSTDPRLPKGSFICTGSGGDPGFEDLGGDAVLYYFQALE